MGYFEDSWREYRERFVRGERNFFDVIREVSIKMAFYAGAIVAAGAILSEKRTEVLNELTDYMSRHRESEEPVVYKIKDGTRCASIVDAVIDALKQFGDEADMEMLVSLTALTRAMGRRIDANLPAPLNFHLQERKKPTDGN